MDEPSWHYLTATSRCTVPRRHVFLAVGGREFRERGVFSRVWDCATAVFYHAPKGKRAKEFRRPHRSIKALWDEVSAWCKPRSRTVLWCWDLSAALRLSKALQTLPRLGWEVTAWSILPQATWLVWRRGDATLTMVELQSFFPTDWPTVAASFASADDADYTFLGPATSAERDVARDAVTTRVAVVRYLDWIERERLGDWQLTGTGQGFGAFRHRFLTHKMLVHWDTDARAAERIAMWAGRTEAFWHGTLRRDLIQEWDLTQAYPRICKRDNVPTELLRTLRPDESIWDWTDRDGYAILAEGVVRTDVPVVPTGRDGRILWPVGEFASTLWSPELRLLRDVGGTVEVQRAWLYRATPALADWAEWIAGRLDDQGDHVAAWQRPILKHWSRAVIGRLGMQHAHWELIGDMPTSGMKWWTQIDADTGDVSDLVHVGRTLWESTGTVDWSLSIPAIPSFVSSRCREIITRIWLELGERKALYVDTDSLLVQARHGATMAAIARAHPEWGLRTKRSWRKVTIFGPRQIITGDRVRVSGVPTRAALLADGTLTGEIREGLRAAISHGRIDRVRSSPRRWRIQGVDRRRQVGADGWTAPIRLTR